MALCEKKEKINVKRKAFYDEHDPEKVKEMMIHGTASEAKKRCVALSKAVSERSEGDKGVDGGWELVAARVERTIRRELVEGKEASNGLGKEMSGKQSSSRVWLACVWFSKCNIQCSDLVEPLGVAPVR